MGIKDFSKVNNGFVIGFFEVMRFFQKFARINDKKRSLKNASGNMKAFDSHVQDIERHHGFIEDQNNYRDLLFGKTDMKHCGCEIFAVYNALQYIGVKKSLPELIQYFEHDGMVLSGKFGTAPKALYRYFKSEMNGVIEQNNYIRSELTTKETEFDALGERYPSLVLTMFNDKRDITKEVHTVCITKDENGQFFAHNVYCDGRVVGPSNSISALISSFNSGAARGISLIGVRKECKMNH